MPTALNQKTMPRRASPAGLCLALAAAALSVAIAGGFAAPEAWAARYEVRPPTNGTCPAQDGIAQTANSLKPGDELVIHDGIYCQTGQRLIAVSGKAGRPITIRAAAGAMPLLTRPEDPSARQRHEGTEVDGAYLILRGLRFHRGNRGLVFHAGSHHITLEDSEIAYTANNGVTLNNGDTDSFVIRRNHIHHVGNLDRAIGLTEGEGLYVGCNRAKCIASKHRIEGNLIHHLMATSGGGNDGIEIKYGSYGNLIRGNIIHTLLADAQSSRFPCIFAYGVRDQDVDKPNVIEGNRLSGCGEAIQVVSDAIVRDNLVLDSQTALATYYHIQVPVQRNLQIVNNTFFGSTLALEFGVNARTEAGTRPPPANIVFSGNAIYGQGLQPLVTVNLPVGGDVTIAGNAVESLSSPGRLTVLATGDLSLPADAFVDGGDAEATFRAAGMGDFRPRETSALRRNGAHIGIGLFNDATGPQE